MPVNIFGLLAPIPPVLLLGAIVVTAMLYYERVPSRPRRAALWFIIVIATLLTAFAPKAGWLALLATPVDAALLAVALLLLAPRKRASMTVTSAVILGLFAAFVVYAMTVGMNGMKM
ncbi:MAG TPA: hypothetical protein VIG32_01545 [Candidatus Baltobacteraceae bacterium]